ncbi:MAG: TlpA family protein disulfide reductase [Verrucomicrobiales bacterium]|nr:TlpA family protein disulfide reductase [Verrucomicrobiales bacterium]
MKDPGSCSRILWVILAAALSWSATVVAAGAEAPQLTRRGSGEVWSWESARGSVVVVDFFAHWCVPCLEVSRQIKAGIDEYYANAGAHPRRVPIRVLPVNVDATGGSRTDRFIRSAGLENVYEDPEGRWMSALGGKGLPFIVILDATGQDWQGTPPVAATFEGFPGLEALRDRIDGLGGVEPARVSDSASHESTSDGVWRWLLARPVSNLLELGTEALWDSNYRLFQSSASWREARPGWEYLMQTGWNRYDLDYEPAPTDFISQPTNLREDMVSVLGRVRVRYHSRLRLELSGGWYDGFSDYRSVWLDEYYRQFFEPVPGYRSADPGGFHVGPALQWEAVPGSMMVQAGLVYQFDQVSPGYEKEPFRPLVRGTENLDTLAGTVGIENVFTDRWRVSQEVRFTDTTDRDLRIGYRFSANGALGSDWVARLVGAVTHEGPSFLSWQVQGSLDFDVDQRWFVGVFGRYYDDNGLVRDPRLVSSASPPLATFRTGLALRHQSGGFSCKLAAGPYWTSYDEVPLISQDFSTLYASREWFFVEAAVGYRF